MTDEQIALDFRPRGRTRVPDHATSEKAARSLNPSRGLYALILEILGTVPLTDEGLRAAVDRLHPGRYAESTVRKRRGELVQAGLVESRGTETNSRGAEMTRWAIARKEEG